MTDDPTSSDDISTKSPEFQPPAESIAEPPTAEPPIAEPIDTSVPSELPAEPPKPIPPPIRRLKIGSERGRISSKPILERPEPDPEPVIAPSIETAAKHTRRNFPPPNIREQLSPELERELEAALGNESIESLIKAEDQPTEGPDLVPDTQVQGTVLKIHRGDIFVDLGGRNQGIVAARQYEGETPPAIGSVIDLVVTRLNLEDGLYELVRPNAAVDVGNWDDVQEGTVVEVTITGANKGGLECKVAGIRGFIPMGQISIYRIENPEEFVDQRLACVVTEVNRDRRNLVLSHRAVMEREKAAAREKLLAELAPGQIREGTVRSLRDFGAFVDLGGVDGLVHISKMSWDRVQHPSEVFHEGQPVKVRIEKIDPDTGKISLSYRDLIENPWASVARKYPAGTTASGKISKIMDFGAFVKLEPGVEGLIHVSELAHGRVWRPSDVVSEGQEVDVKILSVDLETQRISLSLRALQAPPEKKTDDKKEDEEFALPKDAPKKPVKKHTSLKGGLGQSSGGEQFGLKW
ncbi:MAG: S1 RNA-binding domain-containing protein [Pirellulales bacterium]|nr:S1 RNA-binding domain-containing protein [Pirellulales bacterium]